MNNEPLLLIADDEPENLQTIIDILSHSETNYRILRVPNGKLLVEVAIQKLPDLIISDWDMPEMSGIEAVSELKKDPATAQIPVIMCTGVMTSPTDLKQALQAGASDYIRKPVEATELLARVNSMLQLSRSYKQIIAQKESLQLKNEELQILRKKEQEMMENERAYMAENISNKERQLATVTMLSHEKNALLHQLLTQVREVKEQVDNPKVTGLKAAEKLIQKNLNIENSWDSFVYQFENVHPNFFKQIKDKHPAISPTELKTSAYIKIGFSNKEIAQVTNMATTTIKKNVSRLKKRLELGADVDVRDYILKL